jgi:diguanylate cyclase (GGDEF) domain
MKALIRLSKWVAVILFVLIASTLALFLYDFYSIITKSTTTAEKEHLIQNTRTSATMIREKIQGDLDTVYALSSLFTCLKSIDSPDAKILLKKVSNELPFSLLMVTSAEGHVFLNNGGSINTRQTQYLIGPSGGETTISVIYKNALYGRDMIALESPIYLDGKLAGKISGLYYTNYINNILDKAADGNGHQYQIVDRNGNFILSAGMSVFDDYNNLYKFLGNVDFGKEEDKNQIIQDFINRKSGITLYKEKEKANYLCYMPIGIKDWYLISSAPDSGINLQTISIQNPTVTLAFRIILLFILLIIYIVWRQIRYRIAMENSKKELKLLNERLKVKNEALKAKAENDLLTRFYNKVTSELVIADYLLNEGKEGRHALFIIDIDDFKRINDEAGHFIGDIALTEVADSIDHCLRTTDIKGRIGGDEFIVLLKNIKSNDDVNMKASEICRKLMEIKPEGTSKSVSGSIGAAIYPDHAVEFTDLYLKADKAMYYSKELGKGTYYIYNRNMEK